MAKSQQTDPLEVLDNIKQFIEKIEQTSETKAKAFKQAIMVLASPNSIALATNEDVHLSADGQISHSAGDSINLSTQKSFVGHAQSKISLFAAQEGARLFTGKGKIEIQAQGDGADFIARKGIQIISTEDTVYITSPKEIILTADGSQLKINGSGIFPTTGGKFEVKAGQHKFVGGQQVNYSLPALGDLKNFLELNYHWPDLEPMKNAPYLVIFESGQEFKGHLDDKGFAKIPNIPLNESYTVWYGEDQREVEIDVLEDNALETFTAQDEIELEELLKDWDLED